jgi:thiamine-phosphate pyrophosphorylase
VADLGSRRLYLCTADRPDLTAFLAACLRGGVDVVQLRDKDLPDRQIIRRAREAAAVCADFGVPFILNDRPDLALACGADGVHVGQDDTPPEVARTIVGPDAIIGFSTHTRREWDEAGSEPVDYLSAGPVHATPTKPGRPGTGVSYLAYVASTELGASIPWFVTGGVTPETIPPMATAGARRFVVVRYLTESGDPEESARCLRDTILRAVADGRPQGA